MIIGDHKKTIMTIMSNRHPKDGETMSSPMKAEVHKDEGGEIDGRHAAAQDAIMAMHEKSPEKLMQALINFMELHDAHERSESKAEESKE
jgi:hypothetical protein